MHEYRVRDCGLRPTKVPFFIYKAEKEWKGVEMSGVLCDDINKETIAPGTISG